MAGTWYMPIEGTEGIFYGDDEEYPATRWTLLVPTDAIALGSVASCPFYDVIPGFTGPAVIVMSGIQRRGFNPFLSGRNMFQGTYHKIQLATHAGNYYTFPSAMVQEWQWDDSVPASPVWSCKLLSNWKFTDWSGETAA